MNRGAGININLISIERLSAMSSQDKIRFILTEVKRGNVLVLEQGLTATEEAELIKTTMSNIDQDTFIGIEMQSYSAEDVKKGNWLSKLLKRKQPPRMSVIGPADLLRTVHKDGNMIQTMVLTKSSIVDGKEGAPQASGRGPPPRSYPQGISPPRSPLPGGPPQRTPPPEKSKEQQIPSEPEASKGEEAPPSDTKEPETEKNAEKLEDQNKEE